jgi:hypothetical protein
VTSFASRTSPVRASTSCTPPTMSMPHSCISPGHWSRGYDSRGRFRVRPAGTLTDQDPVDGPLRRHHHSATGSAEAQPDPPRVPLRVRALQLRHHHLDLGGA